MKLSRGLLVSPDQDLKLSTVYVGYLILKSIKNKKRVTVFDLYSAVRKMSGGFHFKIIMHALIFLYMNGLIEFNAPYIYNLQEV